MVNRVLQELEAGSRIDVGLTHSIIVDHVLCATRKVSSSPGLVAALASILSKQKCYDVIFNL